MGAGLAAVYLVPALTTQGAVVIEFLQRPYAISFFFPQWDWARPLFHPDDFNERLLWCFSGLALVVACGYAVCFIPNPEADRRTQRAVWVAAGFGVLLMMVPASAWLYEALPPLRMIQFTWRFLAPGTLLGAVLLAVCWPQPGDGRLLRCLHGLGLAVTVVLSVALTWRAYHATCLNPESRREQAAAVDVTGRDVPEYAPRKASLAAAREWMGGEWVKVAAGSAQVNVRQWRARRIELDVQVAGEAQILLRQFHYPGWTARDGTGALLPLLVEPSSGILSVRVPGGSRRVTVQLRAGLAEQVGWVLSLCSLAGAAGWWRTLRRDTTRKTIHEATA